MILIQFSDIRAELTRSGFNFLVDCLGTSVNLIIEFVHAGVEFLSIGINLVIEFAHAGMEFLSIGINLIIEFAHVGMEFPRIGVDLIIELGHVGMEFLRIGVDFINESMKIGVDFIKGNPNLFLVFSDVYTKEIIRPFHISFTGNLPPKNANSANYGY